MPDTPATDLPAAVTRTDLPLPVRRGKVRDVYDVGDGTLVIVATDRLSAFDVVLDDGIPDKGKILTALSLFWFDRLGTQNQVENHLISADADAFPAAVRPFADVLRGRSMHVRRAEVIPVECVARGYLAGSGWAEYQRSRSVCGVPLPPGLALGSQLPEPIFTPAAKADQGHDQNISFDDVVRQQGRPLAEQLRDRTLDLYGRAAAYAAGRGIILADTKFEFGLVDGKLTLVDEALTPDSSRFWPADGYAAGQEQPSFDKQFVRDWLAKQPWGRTPPAPRLPADVIAGTRARYLEAYERLTGRPFA
jgi:phosphoribosylaminoimidazole-succinocarboxamide synthase